MGKKRVVAVELMVSTGEYKGRRGSVVSLAAGGCKKTEYIRRKTKILPMMVLECGCRLVKRKNDSVFKTYECQDQRSWVLPRSVETIIWNKFSGCRGAKQHLPDAELEVLVFDGFLNDTVKASLGFDENDMPVWIEQVTDQPLQDPQWWCEVPFPGAQAEAEA
jgi:hypothetical protein